MHVHIVHILIIRLIRYIVK